MPLVIPLELILTFSNASEKIDLSKPKCKVQNKKV